MGTGTDTLRVFDFGLLFQSLAQSLKEGTLRVSSAHGEKFIYFDHGRVQAIYALRSKIRIGRILYNLRALDRGQLRRVIEDRKAGGVLLPLGEDLRSRGMITQQQLDSAVRYQMTEELLEVFYWKDYSYEFFSGSAEHSIPKLSADYTRVGGDHDVSDLLLNVSRIIDDIEKFNQVTPSLRDVYELTVNPEDYLRETGSSQYLYELLHLIDGVRDMREILRDMRMSRFDVMELLYRLRVDGITRSKNSFELLMLGENQRSTLPPAKLARIYERVRELGVDGFDVSLRLAEVYESLGQPEKAVHHYVEQARKSAEDGALEVATKAARKAVALFPEDSAKREVLVSILAEQDDDEVLFEELCALADLYRTSGALGDEELALSRALALKPGDERLLLSRGRVLEALGHARRAGNVRVNLALLRLTRGDEDGAEKALRSAVRAAPESIRFANFLAGFLAERERPEEAAEVAAHILPVILERGRRHGRKGERGLRAFHLRMRELELTGTSAMRLLADAHLANSDHAPAIEVLLEAAETLREEGNLDRCREVLHRAVELRPGAPEIREHLARALDQVGETDEAVAQLRRAAHSCEEQGAADEAERLFLAILEMRPISPSVIEDLADLLTEQGRDEEAAHRLAQSGHLHRAAGLGERAVDLYDRACRLSPDVPEHLRALAETLADVLQMDRSLESYERLMELLAGRGEHAAAIDAGLRVLDGKGVRAELAQVLETSYRELGSRLRKASARV